MSAVNSWLKEKSDLYTLVASLVLGAIVGLTMGWMLWCPKKTTEISAYAERNRDGSLVLEKRPDAEAKPKQVIPKGAVVERIVYVEVRPKAPDAPTPAPPGTDPGAQATQPSLLPQLSALRVDLTLYRNPDGTRRVAVSSQDGTVTGGMDIPVESAPVQRELKWAAGAVIGTTTWGDKATGVFVDRDFGFVRTGTELTKNTYALQSRMGWEVRAKLGIRF